eukprot:m.48361 g.48361  ORF g.48361 m.48361 type:complete len:131 (-) comp6416_c0_seq1:1821-2213(-)
MVKATIEDGGIGGHVRARARVLQSERSTAPKHPRPRIPANVTNDSTATSASRTPSQAAIVVSGSDMLAQDHGRIPRTAAPITPKNTQAAVEMTAVVSLAATQVTLLKSETDQFFLPNKDCVTKADGSNTL